MLPNRRDFLLSSAGTVSALALPAASYGRVQGANERIRIGLIGCGPYAISDLYLFIWLRRTSHNCQVSHVCDVFTPHLDIAVAKTNGLPVQDYRRILDDKNVDAVMIATPDHWHATMAVDAANAGKDIYLEAPMARTWKEAIEIHDAVQKNNVIFQCGSQLCSDDRYHQVKQIIDGGGIGRLLYVQSSFNRNSRVGFFNRRIWDDVSSKTLDWKAWLGPAPARDFDIERFVRWRKYWDYSGGNATNSIFHNVAAQLIATGVSLPRRVSSGGGRYLDDTGETPDTFFSTIDYENFSFQITSCLGNEQESPPAFFGHEGSVKLLESLQIVRERFFSKEYQEREAEGRFNVVQNARPDHVRQWLESIRNRQRPVCDESVAQAAMIAVHLGELSYRQSRVLSFNADTRQASNS
ncbi:Gfo/Idh/MocA family oxidoreductase [bacterium]|jgi:predicted dehydrogenase|nr:Gfo/Idh/MocA family oxidoreductase [bacterium]